MDAPRSHRPPQTATGANTGATVVPFPAASQAASRRQRPAPRPRKFIPAVALNQAARLEHIAAQAAALAAELQATAAWSPDGAAARIARAASMLETEAARIEAGPELTEGAL